MKLSPRRAAGRGQPVPAGSAHAKHLCLTWNRSRVLSAGTCHLLLVIRELRRRTGVVNVTEHDTLRAIVRVGTFHYRHKVSHFTGGGGDLTQEANMSTTMTVNSPQRKTGLCELPERRTNYKMLFGVQQQWITMEANKLTFRINGHFGSPVTMKNSVVWFLSSGWGFFQFKKLILSLNSEWIEDHFLSLQFPSNPASQVDYAVYM